MLLILRVEILELHADHMAVNEALNLALHDEPAALYFTHLPPILVNLTPPVAVPKSYVISAVALRRKKGCL